MKRLAVGVAGALYGLLLMWMCLYSISHMEWVRSGKAAHGCLDSGDCSALSGTVIVLSAFGPAAVFAVLNAVAWRRWSTRTWAARAGLATLLIVALYGVLA